ncbi:hypothetical protein C0Q70_08580 [Pomacea canaliculata]|uniref:EF-hand domain-containing protein n=1 Tax=Pomacea canaliculata TaxID=400727 RepID=A0A2T7PI75_POMCA|nr:hypothetical protein C0Q70_08580 [Pomacea canaliculata]
MEKHPGTCAKTPCSRSCHGRRAADGAAKKKTAHAFSPTCQTSKGQGQVGAKQGIISPESTATKQGDGASMPTNRCHTEERSDAARRPAAEERRGVESERQEGLAVRARFESPCGSPVWGSSTLGSHKLWPCGTRRRLLDTHSVDKQTSRPSTALSAFSHGSNPNGRVYKKPLRSTAVVVVVVVGDTTRQRLSVGCCKVLRPTLPQRTTGDRYPPHHRSSAVDYILDAVFVVTSHRANRARGRCRPTLAGTERILGGACRGDVRLDTGDVQTSVLVKQQTIALPRPTGMSQPLLSRPVQVNKTVFRRHRSAFARNKPVPKTISRTSSRRSRAGSSQSKKPGDKGQSSASDSENEDTRTRVSDFDNQADIMDEKAWETDLEPEVPEANSTYDHSGRKLYLEECARLGVIPVSYFLRHMTSRQLHMKHHGLRPSDMLAMASVLVNLSDNHLNRCAGELCRILRLNDYLRRVTLAGNGFDDKAAEYFAEFIGASSHVEYLSLSRNSLCERAGQLLGPAISENSCLKELDLSWNQLRRRGAVAVANGIKNNVFMKKINLAWNGFGLEGAVALGDAIKGNSVLEEIDITNNRITTEGAVVIGKGLSANETLKVLKMGINPMQSAGCWGICAAILKNPNSVLQALDFSDVSVNKDFEEILQKVKEQLPGLRVKHGGMDVPLKPKTPVHPMVKLMTYINKNNIRLVDFFNKFDKDGSMSVTPDEFYQGLQETGITLTEEEFQQLLKDLDRDGDGEINYSELVIGHTDFQDKEKKMQTVMTTVRPMTS